MNAEEVKEQFDKNRDSYSGGIVHHGTVVGVLKKVLSNNDTHYRQVLKALTGKTSSKQLTEAEWYALFDLVRPTKPEGGKWMAQDEGELISACNALVRSLDEVPEQGSFL